jgi:hypothetical protein
MSMGDCSTFCSLRRFLSLMVCSFPYRGHSHSLLSLFLGIWLFFEVSVNGIIFLYSFSICSLLMYRKGTDFCILTLYCVTLPKEFMIS